MTFCNVIFFDNLPNFLLPSSTSKQVLQPDSSHPLIIPSPPSSVKLTFQAPSLSALLNSSGAPVASRRKSHSITELICEEEGLGKQAHHQTEEPTPASAPPTTTQFSISGLGLSLTSRSGSNSVPISQVASPTSSSSSSTSPACPTGPNSQRLSLPLSPFTRSRSPLSSPTSINFPQSLPPQANRRVAGSGTYRGRLSQQLVLDRKKQDHLHSYLESLSSDNSNPPSSSSSSTLYPQRPKLDRKHKSVQDLNSKSKLTDQQKENSPTLSPALPILVKRPQLASLNSEPPLTRSSAFAKRSFSHSITAPSTPTLFEEDYFLNQQQSLSPNSYLRELQPSISPRKSNSSSNLNSNFTPSSSNSRRSSAVSTTPSTYNDPQPPPAKSFFSFTSPFSPDSSDPTLNASEQKFTGVFSLTNQDQSFNKPLEPLSPTSTLNSSLQTRRLSNSSPKLRIHNLPLDFEMSNPQGNQPAQQQQLPQQQQQFQRPPPNQQQMGMGRPLPPAGFQGK